MNKFTDIYVKVGRNLYERSFDFKSIDEKKEMFDQELKNYILEKIAEAGNRAVLESEHKDEVSVYDLVGVLGAMIDEKEHFDTLRHLTHVVLNIAGEIQGHSIVWYGSKEDDEIGNPVAEFNAGGLWDSLNTHPDESYVTTFEFTYDIFQNKFMKDLEGNKKFIMTKEGIGFISGESKK